MASFGDTINDPGDIKANGVGFQGITGSKSVQSNAGPTVTFDVFDTMADGVRAIAKIIAAHLNKAGGSETVSQVATDYLGTSQNNAENPNVASYIAAVAQGSGLSANATVTSANIGQLVQGILKGEGTASGVSQADLSSGVTMAGYSLGDGQAYSGNDLLSDAGIAASGFVNSDGTQAVNTIAANSSGQSMISTGAATAAGNATSSSHGAGTNTNSATSGLLSTLSTLLGDFTGAGFATRLVLIILGVILVAAAVFGLTKTNPVDIVAKAAPLAA